MEVYQAISSLKNQQQEILKRHADSDCVNNAEEITKELGELHEKLSHASRVQARDIRDRIFKLERDKNMFLNETSEVEEQIKKKQAMIARLNEKSYKTSIKTQMLGQDVERSEYWHFKDD